MPNTTTPNDDRQERQGRSLAALREELCRNRGGEAAVTTRAAGTVCGHVYNTVENNLILVEDPGSMTGIHIIPLDDIERIAWGKVPLAHFP